MFNKPFDKPRNKDLEGKTFKNSNGEKYNGQRFIIFPDDGSSPLIKNIEVWYLDGKLHGNPAIIYPDGLTEEWREGKFIRVVDLPFHLSKS